jgi:glutathione synthase/RimK-type ligase-like ATP-grasp enzyme
VPKTGIWFTEGFSNLFNALRDIRSADSAGDFKLICSHSHPSFVGGEAADVSLVEPRRKDEGYLAFVERVIAEHNVRVIFPSRAQAFMNRHAERFAQLGATVVTVADTTTLKMVDDKAALYAFLQGKNIVEVPQFRTAVTAKEFVDGYQALKTTNGRVCFKPTHGVYGSGFRVLKESANTIADILEEYPDLQVVAAQRMMGESNFPPLMLMQ